jgi:hypothetical protein
VARSKGSEVIRHARGVKASTFNFPQPLEIQMNQSKLKYARERLHEIVREKQRAVPSTPEHEEALSVTETLKRLRAGATVNWNRVKLDGSKYGRRDSIMNQVRDQLCGADNKAIEKRNIASCNIRQKLLDKISDAAKLVEDELVLGDEAKAMALLTKFAKS